MQILFSYNKPLVIQALRYHFINRMEVRILMILVNVFAIFSATLFYFHKVSPIAFLLSSILWIVIMISFWFFLPGTVYRKASTFKDTFKMTFGEFRIRVESQKGYTEWTWDKFSSYLESPHFFHLYFDSKSFFLVPKEAIEKEGLLQDVRRLLNEKIGRKK